MPGRTNNLAGATGIIYLPRMVAGTLQPVSATTATEITFPPEVIARQPAQQLRRLLWLVASHHGQGANTSALGREFGVDFKTVQRDLEVLEGAYLLRTLSVAATGLGIRRVHVVYSGPDTFAIDEERRFVALAVEGCWPAPNGADRKLNPWPIENRPPPVAMRLRPSDFVVLLSAVAPLAGAEVRVPAFTAYALPDPEAARISERRGVTRWTDPAITVNWYGQFRQTGAVNAQVLVRLPADAESRLSLTVAGASRELSIKGAGEATPVTADFGMFEIPRVGYHRFVLESLNSPGQPFGDLDALELTGPAVAGAHFNLKERRNAASVHLAYPVPPGTNVAAFYCEVTAIEDPPATFYMACGWHRGYFGMQVNSPTERRIIFSVWDSGGEAVDRKKVVDENRVTLMGKGEGVFSGDFGNEGTGGHSHLKYPWRTGETQRFIVTAQPTNQTFTIYSGYYFHPERRAWMLISSWKAPKEGGWLQRLHSFSENFWGSNGHFVRKALYGNQWIRTDEGVWLELTTASFSHDPTGKADRLDRFMGVEDGRFFLSHGGFIEGFTTFGDKFTRPATGKTPTDILLPGVP